jgi:hypothetical protein
MYATQDRDHDALWLLQGELKVNDAIVAKQRTKKQSPRKTRSVATPISSIPATDDQQRKTLRVMCRLADNHGCSAMRKDPGPCTDPRHNADAALAREALLALGILQSAITMPVRVNGAAAKATGVCAQCGRIANLRKDRTVIAHTRSKSAPAGSPHCPGTHMQPRSEATP